MKQLDLFAEHRKELLAMIIRNGITQKDIDNAINAKKKSLNKK